MQDAINHALKQDDVLCDAFLSRIILVGNIDVEIVDLPQVSESTQIIRHDSIHTLPPGPYMADGGHLHQVFRLFEDDMHAVSLPLRTTEPKKYATLH